MNASVHGASRVNEWVNEWAGNPYELTNLTGIKNVTHPELIHMLYLLQSVYWKTVIFESLVNNKMADRH